MSASRRPVLTPLAARPSARFTAVVDLPTPPLPEAMAMMCFTPGTSMRLGAVGPWPVWGPVWAPVRGGGARFGEEALFGEEGAGRSAVMTAVADSTPGMARTACSHA